MSTWLFRHWRLLFHFALTLRTLAVDAGDLKVLFFQNTLQSNDWKDGFSYFTEFVMGGLAISGRSYTLEVLHCNDTLDAAPRIQRCVDMAQTESVDALVVGSSSWNKEIKSAAEPYGIPNLHCSGGNPAIWTPVSDFGFGFHLPFTWYPEQAIRQAVLENLRSAVIIRDSEDAILGSAARAAAESLFRSSGVVGQLRVVGPSLEWCDRWQNVTSCSVQQGRCCCGDEVETATWLSFYEVAESKVVEPGFDSGAQFVSPALVSFVEGIIEDVRSQGEDPEMVLNFLRASRSGMAAMINKKFSYKMYYGGPNVPGNASNGYESYWPNGSRAFGFEESVYNVGAGQWHHLLNFSDPIFGSSRAMVSGYRVKYGHVPSYDSAACIAAGVALTSALENGSWSGLTTMERREWIRSSLGRFQDETVFGRIRFDRNNQNIGRAIVSWQVLEDGEARPVLPTELVQERFRSPSPSWEVRGGCPPGSWAGPRGNLPTKCLPCQEGRFRSTGTSPLNFSECELCPAGRGVLPGHGPGPLVECPPCGAGRYQDGVSDGGTCRKCPLGTFRAANSSSGCVRCTAQSYGDELGLEACKPCPFGSSQWELGQQYCLCEVGFFKNPMDQAPAGTVQACLACDEVLPGGTTLHLGASQRECVCPPGSYWHRVNENSSAFCKNCSRGLVCLGGFDLSNGSSKHQAPLQARGFAAGAALYDGGDPSYVVQCGDNSRCPGGLPLGECMPNSFGFACINCAPGYFDDKGFCRSCSESSFVVWPLIVAGLFVLLALVALYLSATRVDRTHRDSLCIIIFSAGLTFASVNGLPMFSSIDVELVEPLKSLRSVALVLSFDFDVLRPGCWFGSRDPVSSYIVSILCYPGMAFAVLSAFAFGKYVMKKDITWNEVIYAEGVLMLAIFMVFMALTMRPFRCVANPDGSLSLGVHRSVLCWEDSAHLALSITSMVPLFAGVVLFLALLARKAFEYPRRLRRFGGAKWVKQWAFMFGHFTPSCYYFSLILTFRSFLIGLIPVFFTAQSSLLVLSLAFPMCTYSLLQARLWPWRTQFANWMDAGLSLLLNMSMISATTLLDFDIKEELFNVQVLSMIVVVISFLCAAFALGLAVRRVYKPMCRYGVFLSHHKLGAGSLARWFKMMMADTISNRVFLDSDDVNKLDSILDVTSRDTENVVVLITSETLKRMWCAAEIASAWHSNTNIVLVTCDGNDIDEDVIHMVPGLWNDEQEATLVNCGISVDMVVEAYRGLRLNANRVELDRTQAIPRAHLAAVTQSLALCRGLKWKRFSSSRVTLRRGSSDYGAVVMLGDLAAPEAGCCGRVIQTLLRLQVQEDIILLDPVEALSDLNYFRDLLVGVQAILVLLTQGVLHHLQFAASLVMCPEENRKAWVPIRADEFFVYPDPSFWETLADGKIFTEEALSMLGTDFEEVRVVYSQLFNVLALKFTPHGSEHIQATEISLIQGRLEPMLNSAVPERSNSSQSSIQMLMRQNSRRSNSKEPREPPSRDSRETMSGPGCCEAHELTLEEIQNITVVQEEL